MACFANATVSGYSTADLLFSFRAMRCAPVFIYAIKPGIAA